MGNTIEQNLENVLMRTVKSDNIQAMPRMLTDIFSKIYTINSRDYSEAEKFKRYLRAISKNMNESKFRTIRLVKEMLDNWDMNKRLDFLEKMGEILIEFLYGNNIYYFQELDRSVKLVDEVRNDNGHYHYISLRCGVFVHKFLKPIYKLYKHRKSFIDVGCGIGDKTFLAWMSGLFDRCYGIEYSRLTYEIARKTIEKLGHYDTIYYGDAFEHNFENYDTVYFYCPIADTKGMKKLYVQIFEQVKVRTIMKEMLPESGLRSFLEDNEVKRYSGQNIFIQKVYSTKEEKSICKIVRNPKEN